MISGAARAQYFEPADAVSATPTKKPISLLQYSPALVLLLVAIVDSQRYADPDLWGHVRFGQEMLRQGHLTLRDPYSYSAPGHLWLNHEWLTEVLMGWLYNHFGTIGLKLLKFGCSAGVVLFLVEGMTEAGTAPVIQLIVLTAAAVTLALQVQFRPQLFTFVFLSALLAILARFNYRGSARVWLSIPILALWANLHGGFIMGLATLGTFSVVVLTQDVLAARGTRRGLRLLGITAASAIATLATPYGIGTWQAVLHALANPVTRTNISDWQPMTTVLLAQVRDFDPSCFYILLGLGLFIALCVTYGLTPGGDLPLLLIAGVMVVAAFASIRNLPLAVIATTTPLSRHLDHALEVRRERKGLPAELVREPWSRFHQTIVVAIALTLMLVNGLLSNKLVTDGSFPVGAVSFMKKHHLQGNILVNFGWGEYIIWHLAPSSKVSIDGRYDTVYPPDVIKGYISFHYATPGAKEFFAHYPHQFLLFSSDSRALNIASTDTRWKKLYSDDTCSLYGKVNPEIEKIEAVKVDKASTPKSYFP